MTEKSMQTLLHHLKILLEDPGSQITLKAGQTKLEAILNSKVANLEKCLGPSTSAGPEDEKARVSSTFYSPHASFERCSLCSINNKMKKSSLECKEIIHGAKTNNLEDLTKADNVYNIPARTDMSNNHENDSTDTNRIPKANELHWTGIKEKFTIICLGILNKLKEIIEEGNKNDSSNTQKLEKAPKNLILGIKDQKLITAALQFIVSLGICPNFYAGVGVPIYQRTGLSDIFKELNSLVSRDEIFLFFCIRQLCSIARDKVLGTLVITKCLGDIIAALIQIGFQKCKMEETGSSCGNKVNDENKIIELTNGGLPHSSTEAMNKSPVCQHEREWCRTELNELVERIYQPLVIRELLLLQGPGRSNRLKGKPSEPVKGSPKWLRQICGKLLSERLMQKNGVRFVLSVLLEGCATDGNAAYSKLEMIGKLISNSPMIAKSLEEYYKEISPQILSLLEVKSLEAETKNLYARAASSCISWMAVKNISLTRKFIFSSLMQPFDIASTDPRDLEKDELVNENNLSQSVELIHKVFIIGTDPKEHMVELLSEYAQPLFELYSFLRDKLSHLKTLLKEILLWLIHNNTTNKTQSMLTCCLFGKMPHDSMEHSWKTMNARCVYANGPSGGAVLCRLAKDDDDAEFGDMVSTEERIVGLLDLLTATKNKDVVSQFFIYLLQQLSVVSDNKKATISANDLGQIDKNIQALEYEIPLVSMVAAMCDKLGDCVLNDPKQSLNFVKLTLERCSLNSNETKNEEEIGENEFQNETLSMALGILSLVITNMKEIQAQDFKEIQDFLPILKNISESNFSTYIKQLCNDLYVSIATHGAVNEDRGSSKDQTKVENIDLTEDEAFDIAMSELTDPLVPTRGHSLLQLSRLIQSRNAKALSNADKLLDVFMANLCHEDTYIYLAAIQGLVSLADLKHDVVIPYLAKEFAMFGLDVGAEADKQEQGCKLKRTRHSSEMRLKIGEALVKATRQCGPLVPLYAQVLLASLLIGVKDTDADVRASSLSNIGDVCKLLRFSVGPIAHEIMNCIANVLKSDTYSKVRQAAILVVIMLLEGLGKDTIEAIGSVLKDLYRLLKLTAVSEKCESVKWHAERALGELEVVMKKYLFPDQMLQKKIQIL